MAFFFWQKESKKNNHEKGDWKICFQAAQIDRVCLVLRAKESFIMTRVSSWRAYKLLQRSPVRQSRKLEKTHGEFLPISSPIATGWRRSYIKNKIKLQLNPLNKAKSSRLRVKILAISSPFIEFRPKSNSIYLIHCSSQLVKIQPLNKTSSENCLIIFHLHCELR